MSNNSNAKDREILENLIRAILAAGKLFPEDLFKIFRIMIRESEKCFMQAILNLLHMPSGTCETCKSSLVTDTQIDEVMRGLIRGLLDAHVIRESSGTPRLEVTPRRRNSR